MVLKNLSSTYLMKEKELHKLRETKNMMEGRYKNSQMVLSEIETQIFSLRELNATNDKLTYELECLKQTTDDQEGNIHQNTKKMNAVQNITSDISRFEESIKYHLVNQTNYEAACDLRDIHRKRMMFFTIKKFVEQKRLIDQFQKNKVMKIRRDRFTRWFYEVYRSQKIQYLKQKQDMRLLYKGFFNFFMSVRYNKVIQKFHRKRDWKLKRNAIVSLRYNAKIEFEQREMSKIAIEFHEKTMYRAFLISLKNLHFKMRDPPGIYEIKVTNTRLALNSLQKTRIFDNWVNLHKRYLKKHLQLHKNCVLIKERGQKRFIFNTIKRSLEKTKQDESNLKELLKEKTMKCTFNKWSVDYVNFKRKQRKVYKKINYGFVQKYFKLWSNRMDVVITLDKKLKISLNRGKKMLAKRVFKALKELYVYNKNIKNKQRQFRNKIAKRESVRFWKLWQQKVDMKQLFQGM